MTFRSNLNFIGFTVFIFALIIFYFIAVLIIMHSKTGVWQWSETFSGSFFVIVFISLITVPGFLLHFRYYKQDKEKILDFKSNYLEITDRSGISKVFYNEILKVERHSPLWQFKNPWSNYGYIKIIMKNSTAFTYTCLTFEGFINHKDFILEHYEDFYPWC